MGKEYDNLRRGTFQGRCHACKNVFVGPGDRCPSCRDKLRLRRKRKRKPR
jgi:rRNA maturation endonuclease Nob1